MRRDRAERREPLQPRHASPYHYELSSSPLPFFLGVSFSPSPSLYLSYCGFSALCSFLFFALFSVSACPSLFLSARLIALVKRSPACWLLMEVAVRHMTLTNLLWPPTTAAEMIGLLMRLQLVSWSAGYPKITVKQ